MRIRISDIAEELGLSTATVSNVIHGKNMIIFHFVFVTIVIIFPIMWNIM